MSKSAYELMGPRIEKCLSEKDRPQTVKEIAEGLGVATSSIYNVMQLMEVVNVVQMVNLMGRQRYFLKGFYDDKQLSDMFPPKKVKPKPLRRSSIRSPRRSELPVQERFLEEHLADMRRRANVMEGPSALAMIGLQETIEEEILTEDPPRELEVEERRVETPKKIEPFATIQYLPKDVRRLTLGQAKYLKEQLKRLDGYDRIERFKMAFADFSALKQGSYGTVFYFSMGTNPWERVHRVKVDVPISLEMEKPIKRPRRKRKSKYDPIIDQFIELGQDLVEINVKGRKPSYVNSQLRRRINERKLGIAASSAGGSVYLERTKRD